MRRAAALLAGLLLLATAAAVTVTDSSYPVVAGEIVSVGSDLALLPGGVAVSSLGVAAAGTSVGSPVELAAVLGTASPGVAAGAYAYTATAQEAGADSVASGTFAAELRADGVSKGVVYFAQEASDLLSLEGVTLAWEIGATAPTGAVAYEVVVTAA